MNRISGFSETAYPVHPVNPVSLSLTQFMTGSIKIGGGIHVLSHRLKGSLFAGLPLGAEGETRALDIIGIDRFLP
jgi:hypothetical protein